MTEVAPLAGRIFYAMTASYDFIWCCTGLNLLTLMSASTQRTKMLASAQIQMRYWTQVCEQMWLPRQGLAGTPICIAMLAKSRVLQWHQPPSYFSILTSGICMSKHLS